MAAKKTKKKTAKKKATKKNVKKKAAKKSVKKKTGRAARGAGARPRVESVTTRQLDTGGGPSHIVIFQKRSKKNQQLLHGILGVEEDAGINARAGVAVMKARRPGAPRPRLYDRLGVAAVDLSEEECEAVCREPEVATVVANEVRSIPPISAADGLPLPPAPGSSASTTDPRLAYLYGMRDATNAAIRFFGGSGADIPARAAHGDMTGDGAGHSWCLNLIGLHPAYALATGAGVKVAVLDTGIDLNHPDFSGLFEAGRNAESFVPNETVQDGNGHGTHCAGVVGGPSVSNGGIRYGVAPGATLLIGKVLADDGLGFDDWILDGIDWAVEQGAQIISMSLSSKRQVGAPFSVAYETVVRTLLDQSPGVLVIAAAGNSSNRPDLLRPVENPAACPSLLAVAAVDHDRHVGSFSCRQMDTVGLLNLSAPGVAVHSAWTGGFRSINGTSMATPHVAGSAALYLERDPSLTARQLWARLEERAGGLGDPADFGVGLLRVPG